MSIVVTSIVETVLKEAADRIVKKASEGKKLTSSEITLLLMDNMYKSIISMIKATNDRIDDLKDTMNIRINELDKRVNERINSFEQAINERINSLEKGVNERIGSLEKRVEGLVEDVRSLRSEVSSIKSDIINLMKEKIAKPQS